MEEFVRAPLPVQRERLYGNEASARRGAPPGRDAPREVEAFRDFRRARCSSIYMFKEMNE
jgi:hypothetical protein